MAKRERENKRVKSGKRRKRFENVRRKGKRGERKARRENEKIGNTEEGINKRGIARREIAKGVSSRCIDYWRKLLF